MMHNRVRQSHIDAFIRIRFNLFGRVFVIVKETVGHCHFIELVLTPEIPCSELVGMFTGLFGGQLKYFNHMRPFLKLISTASGFIVYILV